MSKEFSTFFEDPVRSLSVEPDEYYLSDTKNLGNPVEIAIRKCENHVSVQAIITFLSVTLKSVLYLRKLQPYIIKRMVPLVISQQSS